jgi:hypothetical protein
VIDQLGAGFASIHGVLLPLVEMHGILIQRDNALTEYSGIWSSGTQPNFDRILGGAANPTGNIAVGTCILKSITDEDKYFLIF